VVQRFDPSPEASPRVFFVGFAGVSRRRVFTEEIKFCEKVVASRFNVNDMNGVQVVCDYGHNVAAMQALAEKREPRFRGV